MKSGENLRQLVTLNLYISFFYFELVRDKKIKSKNIYPWEYVSGSTNYIYKIGQKKNWSAQRKKLFITNSAVFFLIRKSMSQ